MRRVRILATVVVALTGLCAQTVLGDPSEAQRWTFDAGTDDWGGHGAACTVSHSSPNPGNACAAENGWRDDGRLWTQVRSSAPDLTTGHGTWRSPVFTLAEQSAAAFEVALVRAAHLRDGGTAVSEIRLVDARGAVTSLAVEELEPAAEPQPHRYSASEGLAAGDYRLEIATSIAGEGAVGYDDVEILRAAPEPTPSPTPSPVPEPTPRPAPPPPPAEAAVAPEPERGRTARLTPVAGRVLVGDDRRPLESARLVPVGTRVDAEAGRVLVAMEPTEDDRTQFGRLMEAELRDGAFTVHQSRSASLTEFHLDGARPPSRRRAGAAAKRRKPVRRLWGKGKGRFRTVGRYSAATVRGTEWLVEERAAGTYVRVVEGQVLAEEFATGRTVILDAGESFLGRPRCLSRRRFWIRLRIPAGTIVRDVSVRARGRRAAIRPGARPSALVDLRGVPRGQVKVRIRVTPADGRTLTGTRSYRTCSKPRPSRGVPTL